MEERRAQDVSTLYLVTTLDGWASSHKVCSAEHMSLYHVLFSLHALGNLKAS